MLVVINMYKNYKNPKILGQRIVEMQRKGEEARDWGRLAFALKEAVVM